MIEIPGYIWICVALYILIACAKQILTLGMSAEMLNHMRKVNQEEESDNE